MNRRFGSFWGMASLALAVVATCATLAVAADPPKRIVRNGKFNPEHRTVEMFQAVEEGAIEVRFIPKDDTEGRILITNTSGEPLNVQIPDSFAAMPALGQCCGGGCVGGGCGGGAQAGGGGGGGGVFNVPPEALGEVRVPFVCLEHGKPDPRPAIPYKIVPFSEFSDDARLEEVVTLVGKGKLNQRSAQAAAWHLANEMSWEELAAKEIRRANGTRYPYFTRQELLAARAAVTHVEKELASDSESTSLSDGDERE